MTPLRGLNPWLLDNLSPNTIPKWPKQLRYHTWDLIPLYLSAWSLWERHRRYPHSKYIQNGVSGFQAPFFGSQKALKYEVFGLVLSRFKGSSALLSTPKKADVHT